MSETAAALSLVGRSDHVEDAAELLTLRPADGDVTAETSPQSLALVDDAPHIYHVTQSKALGQTIAELRAWETRLRRRVNRWRDRGIRNPCDVVRLFAVRHVLEDLGETLEDI